MQHDCLATMRAADKRDAISIIPPNGMHKIYNCTSRRLYLSLYITMRDKLDGMHDVCALQRTNRLDIQNISLYSLEKIANCNIKYKIYFAKLYNNNLIN